MELAQIANIAVNSLRLYEANKRQPRPNTIESIASALGVSVAELLGQPEPTESDKAAIASIIKEIGLPHGDGKATVAETKKLLQRVAEVYGEKSVILLRLISIMSDDGVDKVIEYAKSIFQEYLDGSIPEEGNKK